MLSIEIPFLNLDKTFESGQHLRWIKLRKSKYVFIHKNQSVKVEQIKQRFIFNCSENDFFNIWFDYLDLGTDYQHLFNKLLHNEDLKPYVERALGIHIVKQDFYESIFAEFLFDILNEEYFVWGSVFQSLLNEFAKSFGGVQHTQSMREAGRVTWYEFPTCQQIIENIDDLEMPSMFKNHKNKILLSCKNYNEVIDFDLSNISKKQAIKIFNQFDGLTIDGLRKALLFGDYKTNILPTDYDDVFEKYFCLNSEEFCEWFFEDEKWLKGFIYIIIKYCKINPFERS